MRFCGKELDVVVKNIPAEVLRECLVFAVFRNVRGFALFDVGDACTVDKLNTMSQPFLKADFVKTISAEENTHLYQIFPQRKWHYPCRVQVGVDEHMLQLFCAMNGKVVARGDSDHFKVVPIWKSEEEPTTDAESKQAKPKKDSKVKTKPEPLADDNKPSSQRNALTLNQQERMIQNANIMFVNPQQQYLQQVMHLNPQLTTYHPHFGTVPVQLHSFSPYAPRQQLQLQQQQQQVQPGSLVNPQQALASQSMAPWQQGFCQTAGCPSPGQHGYHPMYLAYASQATNPALSHSPGNRVLPTVRGAVLNNTASESPLKVNNQQSKST